MRKLKTKNSEPSGTPLLLCPCGRWGQRSREVCPGTVGFARKHPGSLVLCSLGRGATQKRNSEHLVGEGLLVRLCAPEVGDALFLLFASTGRGDLLLAP